MAGRRREEAEGGGAGLVVGATLAVCCQVAVVVMALSNYQTRSQRVTDSKKQQQQRNRPDTLEREEAAARSRAREVYRRRLRVATSVSVPHGLGADRLRVRRPHFQGTRPGRLINANAAIGHQSPRANTIASRK